MSVNADGSPCVDKPRMIRQSEAASSLPFEVARVGERLLAHARLCRQIAEQSWSEEIAGKLRVLADECDRAAEELRPFGMVNHGRPV
jgi:hypothetical protein